MQGNCQKCGTFRKWLHKHHLKLQSEGGTDKDGVAFICANCHEDEHGGPCGGVSRGRLSATPEARLKKGKTFKRLWSEPDFRNKTVQAQAQARLDGRRDDKAIGKKISASWTPERRATHSTLISKLRKTRNWSTKSSKPNGDQLLLITNQ